MSSKLGGPESFSTSLACVWVCMVSWGSVVNSVLVFGSGSIRLAVFLSRVMRFSRRISPFEMGECSLVLVSLVGGVAIGHVF
jgi:hypothetical protein